TGSRPFPFPAHQTGRALSEHPAFRQTSPSVHGRLRQYHEAKHAQLSEHNLVREPGSAKRVHFVAPSQEHPHALIDVVIDGPIRRVPIPQTEVRRPASQSCIEAISHFRPWLHVSRLHQVSHFPAESGHALLGRTFSQIYVATLATAVRPERISQKVEPLRVSPSYVGFRLVQS